MVMSLAEVRRDWSRLEAEFEPKIVAARVELEEIESEYKDVRRRRDAALDKHKQLVDRYNAEWRVVQEA